MHAHMHVCVKKCMYVRDIIYKYVIIALADQECTIPGWS